ncbi:MAG: IS66 family transposase [Xenococcus sp. MO_188.B8]|nr:IS66 family transposase [Xenococcus sp. MO_188.B8]
MSNSIITSEILVAYSQCPRKAFLLLFAEDKGLSNEYMQVLEQKKNNNRTKYIDFLRKSFQIEAYSQNALYRKNDYLFEVNLVNNSLLASCDLLKKVEGKSNFGKYSYEAIIISGSYKVTNEQKLELLFASYVLKQIQNELPATGSIISLDGKVHNLETAKSNKKLKSFLKPLKEWIKHPPSEETPVLLNKHCAYCQFQASCRDKANKSNDLSLLDRMTAKSIQKYHKKGIFTITQLSYLFKPRRRNKKAKKTPIKHSFELQALALRTGKIYLQELPNLVRQPKELFLDIEGIPDQGFNYLIGLLVCEEGNTVYYSFWANTINDEEEIWLQVVNKVNEYPEAPIYHYGSYESKALNQVSKKYQINCELFQKRLININTFIYGKIYFPTVSNRLKDIGKFLGASWDNDISSGIQSLVFRYYWEESQDLKYQESLVAYNEEDCRALKLLTDKISEIIKTADDNADIDFANSPKQVSTELGTKIHNQFDTILKFAHTDYNRKKISLNQNNLEQQEQSTKKLNKRGGHLGHSRKVPKARKIVDVPIKLKCPRCVNEPLQESAKMIERTMIDLVFTKNGCKKTIIKYIGAKGYCQKCYRYYAPDFPEFITNFSTQLFGHRFQSWVIYQRLALRLPYSVIAQTIEDLFSESISQGSIDYWLKKFAKYYSETEKLLTEKILTSPFIHADETPINIRGSNHYVWVFTDAKHVVFKMTETREANIVYDFLGDYSGVLVSDFYPGYDGVKCRQQKCWVHLIRDLNDDLWKNPFDTDFEAFVLEVKNLILPILETVEKYGLKHRHLRKFKKNVDIFYNNTINRTYYSEPILKYQKRFERYKGSLFTFLEQDFIPWNNNMAERAIRHLAVQRKISGSFSKSGASAYLTLLGVMQTCKFQNKSLLKFLLSQQKDIDQFKESRRTKNSAVAKS